MKPHNPFQLAQDPKMAPTTAGAEKTNSLRQPHTRIYFAIYCMLFAMDGFTLGFLGAVYMELQENLNASLHEMSWICFAMAIGYMIANVGCGYIADHVKEIHRVHAPIILVYSLCIMYVPYCKSATVMFVIISLIGVGWAAIETNEVLFTFRLYPMSDGKMITYGSIIAVVFGALTPLFFETSIVYFDSMEYPFVIFGIIGIVHSILVLFLKTPQHDELRSIKKSVAKISVENQSTSTTTTQSTNNIEANKENLDVLAKSAASQLQKTKNYKILQNVTIVLLMLIMMIEGCVIRGYLSFIATYCVDHLAISESWSRYYIVCIYASYAGYRIVKCILFPNFSAMRQVTASSVFRLICGITFIFYGNGVVSLFVIYILIGLSGSPVLPSLLTWGESITPTTGIISCSWWIFYGIGDAAMSFTLGYLIDVHGAQIMPIAVAIALGFGLIFNVCAVVMSNVLRQKQAKVFAETVAKVTIESSGDGEPNEKSKSAV